MIILIYIGFASAYEGRMRSHILFALKLALAGWIIWFLAHSNLLEPKALKALLRPDAPLLFALMALVATVMLAAYRWWLLLRVQGIGVPLLQTLKPSYVGFGLNQFLPGGVGGDVVRLAFVLRIAADSKTRGITTLLADRALGLASLMALTLYLFISHRGDLPDNPHLMVMVDASAVCISLGLLVAVVAIFLPDDLGFSRWIHARIPHAPLVDALVNTAAALHSFRRTPLQVGASFVVSLGVQLMVAVTLYHISTLMGFSVALWHLILASSVAQIAALLPLTPGGIGVGEVAFAGMLTLLGYPAALGLSSILIGFRVLSVFISLPAYVVYFKSKHL